MKHFIGSLILIIALFLAGCQSTGTPSPQPVVTAPATTKSVPAVSAVAPSVSFPSTLTKRVVKNAVQRQAVCNDGTPAVYYFKRGSGADASHWIIFLQGGGWCSNGPACALRWRSQRYLMTSQNAPAIMPVGGIFSSFSQMNPDFLNFTQVYVKYCSSDIYSGDLQQQVSGMTMQFRGHQIVAAIIADLEDPTVIPSPNLKNATQVLVGGSSAGSYGAASNIDWITSQLTWEK